MISEFLSISLHRHVQFEPVSWEDCDQPRSARFQDVYRPAVGGLTQARDVFMRGCGLPQRWSDKSTFRILETGFGLGLNFLASWQAWTADQRRCEQLEFCSIEAFPVDPGQIMRNVAALGLQTDAAHELSAMAEQLAQQWGSVQPGWNTLGFADDRVRLNVLVGDVNEMLPQVVGPIDAIYLDGFAPSRNPEMWADKVMQALAGLSLPGTTLATYTVARTVRDGLAAAGFDAQRLLGTPPKRHRLQAVFVGKGTSTATAPDPWR